MDKDIKNMVKSCKSFASVTKAPPLNFNSWPKTDKLWSRLHIDSAGLIKGTQFFVIVDSFTKCPEVLKYKMSKTKTTIKVLQELFARYGLSENNASDSGTPFISKEFEISVYCSR